MPRPASPFKPTELIMSTTHPTTTTQINKTMRAQVLETHGGPFRLTEIAKPQPGKGQVLVRIHASGVNPLDLKIRAGAAAHAEQPLPAVLGIDLAGVVAAVGPDVAGVKIGDEVYGMTGGVGGIQGSLAEYAAVDAALLAKKPHNLTMREAAALPLIIITAWEGLVDRAALRSKPGATVLVQGGGGGVGHVAIQIAKALGAKVFATESTAKKSLVERLGATFIDRATPSVEDFVAAQTAGEGFDIVYDTVGGAVLDASFQAVRRYHGHVVSCLGWGTHKLAPLSFRAASYSGVFTLYPLLSGKGRAHHGEILQQATQLIEAGQLLPILDPRSFALDDIEAAYQAMEDRSAKGKIVIEVDA
jgi:NADPH:quinone reductase-like Zn-dependent oxidoreductase